MNTYRLMFHELAAHEHPHPERTAYRNATARALDPDVICKVWPSRGAMLTTVRMQERRESRPTDWRPIVKPRLGR